MVDTFVTNVACEEVYTEPYQGVLDAKQVLFVTPNKVIEAEFLGGQLLRARGVKCLVESIELNHVKVTKGDKEYILPLGDSVQWLHEDEGRLQ